MIHRTVRTLTAGLAAAALGAAALGTAPAAQASGKPTSLAQVLAADGNKFDKKWGDFDILDRAVRTVLAEKPDSAVGVLAKKRATLTAFLPTDRAFQGAAELLTGSKPATEKDTFNALAEAAGIDVIETVLLYHVVPGATIDRATALKADGAALTTAQGGAITVDIVPNRKIVLRDADPDNTDPRVRWDAYDINKGNKQIAHGIDRVLRPIDL